jgi:serine phosphatase RsbU (regulator of sigma subunit)
MTTAMDLQTELAVFQLLEEDLQVIFFSEDAQKKALNAAVSGAESISSVTKPVPDADIQVALRLIAVDAQIARDQAYAESLQSQEASLAVGRQYAQRLAAEEQKFRIDGEFAKRLQARDENGAHGCDADR